MRVKGGNFQSAQLLTCCSTIAPLGQTETNGHIGVIGCVQLLSKVQLVEVRIWTGSFKAIFLIQVRLWLCTMTMIIPFLWCEHHTSELCEMLKSPERDGLHFCGGAAPTETRTPSCIRQACFPAALLEL